MNLRLMAAELRRAQFMHDGHAGTGADAVCSGINHCLGGGGSADSSGSFDAGAMSDNASHQRDVLSGCPAQKACGGLDEVGFGSEAQFAAQNLFFKSEERSFKDHFNSRSGRVRHFNYGSDIVLHSLAIAGLERAEVQHHIEFLRAETDCLFSLKTLYRCVIGAKGKADGGGDLHRRSAQARRGQAYPIGADADGGKVEKESFITEANNLVAGGVRLKESMVNAAGQGLPRAYKDLRITQDV